MIDQADEKETANPLGLSRRGNNTSNVRTLYGELCQVEVLQRAYAELVEHATHSGASKHLPSEDMEGFVALGKDLEGRTYQPTQGSERSTLRDMIVQAALRLVLQPLFSRPSPSAREHEQRVQWVARSIGHGLLRAYAEELTPSPDGLPDGPLVAAVRERVDDIELVALFERTLASLPDARERTLLAPLLAKIALSGIDGILDQAKALGRRDGILNVNGARFGNEILVLVDGNADYDWVLPAVQGRVRTACADLNIITDPAKTQLVDLASGQALSFLGFEFRCSFTQEKKARVHYRSLRGGKESESTEAEPQRKAHAEVFRRLARAFLLFPKRLCSALACLIPGLLVVSAPHRGELAEKVKTFLLGDWRTVAGGSWHGLKSFAASLRKNWELTAVALCAVSVLVVSLQLLGELPWEKAVPDDLPGFFTGAYFWSYDTKPVRYGLYIPPRFAADDEGRSLIVSIDDFGQPTQSLQHGLASAIRGRVKNGAGFGLAVFFPGHPKGRWATSEKVHSIMEALDHVVTRHRIDPKRVYLAGYAQGSCAAWDLAAAYPERWAAVVAVSAACMPNSYEADGIARARIPCWVFKGALDKQVAGARELAQALQESRGEMRQTEYPKAARDIWKDVFAEETLFVWLGQKSTP